MSMESNRTRKQGFLTLHRTKWSLRTSEDIWKRMELSTPILQKRRSLDLTSFLLRKVRQEDQSVSTKGEDTRQAGSLRALRGHATSLDRKQKGMDSRSKVEKKQRILWDRSFKGSRLGGKKKRLVSLRHAEHLGNALTRIVGRIREDSKNGCPEARGKRCS